MICTKKRDQSSSSSSSSLLNPFSSLKWCLSWRTTQK